MSDQKIDVAVIGAGRMGQHHARNYHQLEQANLVAIVDTDEDRAGAMADQYQCDVLPSVSELIAKYPNVKAASVSTPTITHEPIARELISHGVACLVEKPLAESVAVGQSIVDYAEEKGVLVQVGHSERFNPIVRALAGIEITPRYIEVDRVSPMTFRSTDVSVVFEEHDHLIFLLVFVVVLLLTCSRGSFLVQPMSHSVVDATDIRKNNDTRPAQKLR